MTEFRRRRVEVNGIGLHLVEAGPEHSARPPVVLLHGFPELWYSWRHQLRALGKSYRLAAPDLRGFGQSDLPAQGYDPSTLAADMAGLIDLLGGRAYLAGHDWGGIIAWHTALAYPDKVVKLAVLAGPHPARYEELFFFHPGQFLKSLYVLWFLVPRLSEWSLSRNRGALLARLLPLSAARPEAFGPDDLEVYRAAWSDRARMAAGLAYYRQMAWLNWEGREFYRRGKVQCPGLVVWGDRDWFLTRAQTKKLEKYFVAPPQIEIIRDCGHWLQQEAPEELSRLLLDFFGAT